MTPTRPPLRPLTRRILIAVLVLEVLAYGGYLGLIWRARHVAQRWVDDGHDQHLICFATFGPPVLDSEDGGNHIEFVDAWREIPWYGTWSNRYGYEPKRSRFEYLKLVTGQNLHNDPSVWKNWLNQTDEAYWDGKRLVSWDAWFKANPDRIWDDRLKRLVYRNPEAKP